MKFSYDMNVMVPMQDGTNLSTDIFAPADGEPRPVLLIRTAYGKHHSELGWDSTWGLSNPKFYAVLEAGYSLVVQGVRGTFDSEGVFQPFLNEAEDAADAVRWITEQPWSNGKVATAGLSYLGIDQWQGASSGVPGLVAIAPSFGPGDIYNGVWYSTGGAMWGGAATWATGNAMIQMQRKLALGEADPADIEEFGALLADPLALASATPMAHKPVVSKYLPWFDDVMAHADRDDFWTQQSSIDRAEKITTPAFTILGWYDAFLRGGLEMYKAVQERGGSEEARSGQRLIIGPWAHDSSGFGSVDPDRDFGPTASLGATQITDQQLAFFDYWLKDDKNALDRYSPVQLFVMGINEWRGEESWPLPDTQYVEYHLHGNGLANTADGDGVLDPSTAAETLGTDTFLYDPRRPVPTLGAPLLGALAARDQSPVEVRDDVLCYTTPVLDTAIEVTGPISLTLFVSSSAVDTDFTAKLVDVQADGKAIPVSEGILRMRYRKSLARPELMNPAEVYEVTIDVGATSNVFLAGHRIRLEVSSSNFPNYNRNSNTGGHISTERLEDMVSALNSVHHGPDFPSRLVLPVIER